MKGTGLLSTLADLCNLPNKNLSVCITNEQNLRKWIRDTSEKILKDVIPETFWSDHNLSKPSKVSQLCPYTVNDSVLVLLVVLWSWCSPKCCREITVCLKYGAKNWQTDDEFKPIDWLRIYVKIIWICVVYSSREIRSQAEIEGVSAFAKQTVLIDAYALSQAVSNSSEWFCILKSKEVPISVFRVFADHYLTTMRKLKANFTGSVRKLSVFSDNDRNVVTYWSIANWFKRTFILPPLIEIMTLDPMAELATQITTLRHTKDEPDPDQKMFISSYQKVSDEASQKLELENSVDCRLAVFAELVQQILPKKTKPAIIVKEKFVLKILCPVLLDAAMNRKCGIVLLKEMMTKKPPLIPDDFVKAVSINVTCHNSETNSKSQNTKSSKIGVHAPKKNKFKKNNLMKPSEKEKAKKLKSLKAKKRSTAEKVPNGVNREETATTKQVNIGRTNNKKRKNDSPHQDRKSSQTNDGMNECTSQEDEVGEEEKKVNQTQLNNKTEGDEDDTTVLSQLTLTLSQLGTVPKGKQLGKGTVSKENSPYTTKLIGYDKNRKNTTRQKSTSPNVILTDANIKHTVSNEERKSIPTNDDMNERTSEGEEAGKKGKVQPKKTTASRTGKDLVTSANENKEQYHKWGQDKTVDMKRTSAILDYFNEEGEINSYRERWTRCEKIIEEHSQYFQPKKTKKKKTNIVQDLVVLHLALIIFGNKFRVEKMGQTANKHDKLERKTYEEIEKSMKSFDWKNYHIRKILSHLTVSFELLQTPGYVNDIVDQYGEDTDKESDGNDDIVKEFDGITSSC